MPMPKGTWWPQAREWASQGVSAKQAAARWGIKYDAALARLRKAKREMQGAAAPERAAVETGLGVTLARVIDLLADIAVANKVLLERTAKLEKRLAELAKPQATTTPASPPKPDEGKPAKHDAQRPPPSLWVWIVGECRAALGEGGVAQALGVDTSEVRHWHGGRVPSSKHRQELRHLLATLYGRETFASYDDLEDARERVFLYKTQGAEV